MASASPLDNPPRYLCQRCGNCCRWPGDVRLAEGEAAAIAAFLGMSEEAFIQDCTRLNANRTGLSIIDKPNGECLFLEGRNTCRIQPAKPAQCRGFPNTWNFPGWRELCEAVEARVGGEPADAGCGRDGSNGSGSVCGTGVTGAWEARPGHSKS